MSNTVNDGGPAFPGVEYKRTGDERGVSVMTIVGGMTLRDFFAAAAMNGICSSRNHSDLKGHALASARVAYALADAMLKAREAK